MRGRRSLVGLIGANIMSSLSPALQEDAFAAAGIRGTYHLMDLDRLPGRRLEHLMAAVKAAGFDGINVTFPCKTAVLPLLEEVSADARQIGAVNCVTIANDGRTVGYNTDRIGFRRNFEDGLGRACIEGKAVLVGAGGAGRAVAFALMDLGAARVWRARHGHGAGRRARGGPHTALRLGTLPAGRFPSRRNRHGRRRSSIRIRSECRASLETPCRLPRSARTIGSPMSSIRRSRRN